jgi:5-methylcytosine-specific restriction endonuclease McrA
MATTDKRLWTRRYRLLRYYVLARDRNVCQIRGPNCQHVATCVDHVVDRADGGAVYDPTNLRAACVPCNSWRSAVRTNALVRSRRRYGYRTSVPDYDTRL